MQEVADHIRNLDENVLWNELASRIQRAHDTHTDGGDTVLITLTISDHLVTNGAGLDRGVALGVTWAVDEVEETKQKLADTGDAILEFDADQPIYVDEIREELVRAITEADSDT